MTAENFAYWLKGYFELHAALARVPQPQGTPERSVYPTLSYEQVAEISRHLDYVFAPAKTTTPSTTSGIGDYLKVGALDAFKTC